MKVNPIDQMMKFIVFEYDDTYSSVGDDIILTSDGRYVKISDLLEHWMASGKPWQQHSESNPAPVKRQVFSYIKEDDGVEDDHDDCESDQYYCENNLCDQPECHRCFPRFPRKVMFAFYLLTALTK